MGRSFLCFAFVCGFSFAVAQGQNDFEGISFSSSGSAIFIPAANSRMVDGDVAIVGAMMQSDGLPAPRVGLSVHGVSQHIGFDLDIFADGALLGWSCDNALIWVRPASWAVFTLAGAIDKNVLQSSASYGLRYWSRIGTYFYDDTDNWIFPDLLDKTVSVVITPVDFLTIGAAMNVPLSTPRASGLPHPIDADTNLWNLKNIFGRNSSIALAFDVPLVGAVKLGLSGYIGGSREKNNGKIMELTEGAQVRDGIVYANYEEKIPLIINFAIEITEYKGFYLGFGADIPTASGVNTGGHFASTIIEQSVVDDNVYSWLSPRLNIYSRISLIENLNMHFRTGVKIRHIDLNTEDWTDNTAGWRPEGNSFLLIDKKYSGLIPKTNAVGFLVGTGVEYFFDSPNIEIFADISYADGIWMAGSSLPNNDTLTFGTGVSKIYSNGRIGIAFELATNGHRYGRFSLHANSIALEVPIRVEYKF